VETLAVLPLRQIWRLRHGSSSSPRWPSLAVILAKIYSKWLQLRWVKNPKGFGFYL
jgi:hypothetical protein